MTSLRQTVRTMIRQELGTFPTVVESGGSGLPVQPGEPGKSAYQLWLDLGNTGSLQDFMDSLRGGPGSGTDTTTTANITDTPGKRFTNDTEKAKLAGIASSATANDTDANLKNRANHTGTQSADTITDGGGNKVYTATERAKLSGIAAGATLNDTDSNLRNRATHTGVQTAATISDLTETVQDIVAGLLGAGSNITLSYNDAANSLTITSTGGGTTDPEAVRDAIGVALVGVGGISVSVNDAADTITITTSATTNSTDAQLRDRTTHTGTQSADTITDGTTNKVYTATDKAKLAGISPGATANQTDAFLRNRANHTGTQSMDTMTEGTVNKLFLAAEQARLQTVATEATKNATDAQLRDRATHTGTQPSSTISDFYSMVLEVMGDSIAPIGTMGFGWDGGAYLLTTTATANSTDAQLRDRATHTGTQSADTITDGASNKVYTAAEKTKLAGVAVGATANSADATLLNRANHTGSQSAATISGLAASATTDTTTTANISDTVAKRFTSDTEKTKLSGIAAGATVNDTDANLKNRANHTGTQSADTLIDGATNKLYTATEKNKLASAAAWSSAKAAKAVTNAATGYQLNHGFGTLLGLSQTQFLVVVQGFDANGDLVSGIRSHPVSGDITSLEFVDALTLTGYLTYEAYLLVP